MFSYNGSTFTDLSAELTAAGWTERITFIAASGTNWLIGGGLGLFFYDGTTFTDRSGELAAAGWTSGEIRAIAGGGTGWLIGGMSGDGLKLFSCDVSTLTDLSGELAAAGWTDGEIYGIAAGGTGWVIGGWRGAGIASLFYFNGTAFTDHSGELSGWASGKGTQAIAGSGTDWLIGGYDDELWDGPRLFSYNGTEVTDRRDELIAAGFDGLIFAIAASGTEWLIGGFDQPYSPGLYSWDGSTFTNRSAGLIAAGWPRGEIRAIAGRGTDWLIGGYDGDTGVPKLFSWDGTAFTDHSGELTGWSSGYLNAIAANGTGWLIGGYGMDGGYDTPKLFSFDGTSLVDRTGEIGAVGWSLGTVNTIAVSGTDWLIGGDDYGIGELTRLISFDGTSFTNLTGEMGTAGWTNGYIRSIAASGTGWLIGGNVTDPAGMFSPQPKILYYNGAFFSDEMGNLKNPGCTFPIGSNQAGQFLLGDRGRYNLGRSPTPPTPRPDHLSVVINGGADYTSSRSVTLAIGARNATQMKIYGDVEGPGADAWIPYATSATVSLTEGEGEKTVKVDFRGAGGTAGPAADSIYYSTTAPAKAFTLSDRTSGSREYTNEREAAVTLDGALAAALFEGQALAIPAPVLAEMMFSQSPDFAGAAWQGYAASTVFSLSEGDGPKTVYAKFKNSIGQESAATSASIVLDMTPPEEMKRITDGRGRALISGDPVGRTDRLEIQAHLADATSGIDPEAISVGLGSSASGAAIEAGSKFQEFDAETGTLIFWQNGLAAGSYTLTIGCRDKAGNPMAEFSLDRLIVLSSDAAEGFYDGGVRPVVVKTGDGYRITYTLTNNMTIELRVYSLRGALLWRREIISGNPGAEIGFNSVVWDGRDSFGGVLPRGAYIIQVTSYGKRLGVIRFAII